MNFRRKLLAVFALTVILSVGVVTGVVSYVTRRAFAQANEERTAALVAQFRREFNRRGLEITRRVEAIAGSDATTRIALAVNREAADYGTFLSDAKAAADSQQLDFLEFVDDQGKIISSAQWPAKFGYKEGRAFSPSTVMKDAFLKQEELPNGSALGLFAVREVDLADKPLYVIGGQRMDKDFLASIELPTGMRVLFYQNLGNSFSPQLLVDPAGNLQQSEKLGPIVELVRQSGKDAITTIHWSIDTADDENFHAMPLSGEDNQLLGILLIGNAQRSSVELNRHIGSAALLALGAGIVLAVIFSGWAAARVTRPVEQLAEAAREVTSGNWNVQAEVTSTDELAQLAESFNRMTSELLEQKERLVQTERVAAWRELARRLAHELKNPLFPLQLTVENLLRARQQAPEQFEEIFRESSATLLAEIANLKTIIGRFSEFSRMPQPRWQACDVNEVVRKVARLFQAQLNTPGGASIQCKVELDNKLEPIAADPELLHRAFSNLVLNAMDAMPQGGTLTLHTRQEGLHTVLEVSDTGKGLTPEECKRLFTPYYTSKEHGTGLGLAIVQSVISDHGGKISVRSQPGSGATFRIELPSNIDKLKSDALARASDITQ